MKRTTVRLDDALLDRAKREAARRNTTVTSLIEAGLRLMLARGNQPFKRVHVALPVSTATGGTLAGVNLNNSAALLDLMDQQS